MPTEGNQDASEPAMHPLAARRILRLSLGTAASLCFSQIINWPFSFIAPLLTLMILALPLPPPRLKMGIGFIVAMLAPVTLGLALLPFLEHFRWVGMLLLTLGLFYSFYFTARGGSAILGTFMTIGLTLIVTIGSVSSEVMIALIKSLVISAFAGMAFVWIAHALLPDPAQGTKQGPLAAGASDPADALRNSLRSLLVVLPITLLFLFISGSPAYTVVMIKVATMGQQASVEQSGEMGRELLKSTLWGGLGAILAWSLLSAWPSLLLYTLLIGLAGLVYGRRIFRGAALHPDFSMWSFAFLTMLVLLGPAVLDSPFVGSGPAFWWRLFLFLLIAVYGTVSVAVFDAFWPRRKANHPAAPEAAPVAQR